MAEKALKRNAVPSGVYWATVSRLVKQHPGSGRFVARALYQLEHAETLPLRGDSQVTPATFGVSRRYCVHRLGHFHLWLWYAVPYGGDVMLYAVRDVPPPEGGPK
jgi:hypothetical protein